MLRPATRLFLAALSLLFATNAAAEGWPALDAPLDIQRSDRSDVAIVVGIEDYLVLPDVSGAQKNASEWASFFRDRLGVTTVITLRDAEATREEMLLAAERARDRAGRYGTIWFVFVGHGAPSPNGSSGLLIGADGQQTVHSVASRSVSQTELVKTLTANRRAQTIMIVDACFSGNDGEGAPLVPGVQPAIPMDSFRVPDGVTMLTAARGNEFAGPLPGTQRPAFSYLMLGAMRGWADDGDGKVSAGEALRFARHELGTVVGRTQTPQLFGDDRVVLTSGVHEKRPAVSIAPAAPAVKKVATTTRAPRREWREDPVTDEIGFVKAHLGGGFKDGIENAGVTFMATPGIKFVTGRRWDVRASALFGVADVRNDLAPIIGEVANETGARYSRVSDARYALMTAAAGPGFAYRLKHTGKGWDRGLYFDTYAGIQTGKACAEYSSRPTSFTVSDPDYEAECLLKRSDPDFVIGGRIGGELPVFDLAATMLYRLDGSYTVAIMAGFSIDR